MKNFSLTPHFTFFELTRTAIPALQEINRLKAAFCLPALTELCAVLLEPLRLRFGQPLIVHSGFRCKAVNTEVGGSASSQHLLGQAADFNIKDIPAEEVFYAAAAMKRLPFGQLIHETRPGGMQWVHLSLGPPWRPAAASGQVFACNGKTTKKHEGGFIHDYNN